MTTTTSPHTIKLHKFLAAAGIASRRKSEELIKEGLVTVNKQVATIGQRIDPATDTVSYQGKTITASQECAYYLVNKPVGVVSTTQDELHRPTVLSLLPPSLLKASGRLYPVGRLDLESEGLVLLTNDGELTQLLTHPKHHIPKTYHVRLDRYPSRLAIDHLRRGVKLKEGFTQPAQVEILPSEEKSNEVWLSMTITEGRNHQVRRMLERVGYEVKRLIRVRLGHWSLDELGDEPYLDISPSALQFRSTLI